MPRSILMFSTGFAAGVLSLTVLLVLGGAVGPHVIHAAAPQGQAAQQSTGSRRVPVQAAFPERSAESATAQSQAGEKYLEQRHLLIPVQGMESRDIHDTFTDARQGHSHEALDLMAARGTPVLATDTGRIEKLFLSKPGGITIYQFDPSREYCYYYAHLDRYAPGLKEGMTVQKGDVIGFVGSTGNASADAPHLHFTIFRLGPEKHWWQGTAVDPFPYLVPNS